MADEKVTLLNLSFGTSEAEAGLDALIQKGIELAESKKTVQAAMKAEKAALDEVAKSYTAGVASQKDLEEATQKYNKAMIDCNKQLLDNKTQTAENSREVKAAKTIIDSQASSVNAMRAQLALNTAELNKMSESERTMTKAGVDLTNATKALSDKLKDLEGSVGDNRRSVGAYAEGVAKGIQNTQGLGGATGALVGGMQSGISGIKAFNMALSANPIGAIVTLVFSLVAIVEKMVKRNSELAASLKAAFAPFETIFTGLLDAITELFKVVAEAIVWISGKVMEFLNTVGLVSDETIKAAKAAGELAKQEQAIYEAETAALVPMQKLRREMEELKTLAADQTKSTKEREDLLKQATDKLHQIRDIEVGILQSKYDQIKAQNALTYSTAEDRRKEQEALAALETAKAGYATQEKEVLGQITGFQKAEMDKRTANAKAATDKQLADAKAAAKKLEDEKKKIQDETLKQYSQAVEVMQLEIAERELQRGKDAGKADLEEQRRLADAKIEVERYRLSQNLITEKEFNIAKRQIDLEFATQVEQDRQEREQAEKDRQALELENNRALEEMKIESDLEREIYRLDQKRAVEIANAEAIGADTTAIVERYEMLKNKIYASYSNQKLAVAADVAGQISNLLGQESAAGKAFALAQATINTYQGATKALAQGGFWGIAQAALVIAAGLKNVVSIVKVKEPDTKINANVKKFAKGGQIYGNRHSQGGVTFTGSNGQVFEAEGGENMYILNRSASAAINALSTLNQEHGGKAFTRSGMYKYADGGMISVTGNKVKIPSSMKLSDDSISKLAFVVIEAITSAPNPVVSVSDIDREQNNLVIVQGAAAL